MAIIKGLLALKKCLLSLAGAPKAPRRPPFRDSPLTRILEDALSGGGVPSEARRDSAETLLFRSSALHCHSYGTPRVLISCCVLRGFFF